MERTASWGEKMKTGWGEHDGGLGWGRIKEMIPSHLNFFPIKNLHAGRAKMAA